MKSSGVYILRGTSSADSANRKNSAGPPVRKRGINLNNAKRQE